MKQEWEIEKFTSRASRPGTVLFLYLPRLPHSGCPAMTQVADSPLFDQARVSFALRAERAAPGRGAQLVCGSSLTFRKTR